MQSPPWLIRLSNWGAVAAVVGALYLGIQMTRRLRSRVVVTSLPSLSQLAEVAIARADYTAAIAETKGVQRFLPPMWRDVSSFTGRVHARYRRAFAEQRAWQNVQARAAFVAFFSPTVPELPVYRSARQRFDATP